MKTKLYLIGLLMLLGTSIAFSAEDGLGNEVDESTLQNTAQVERAINVSIATVDAVKEEITQLAETESLQQEAQIAADTAQTEANTAQATADEEQAQADDAQAAANADPENAELQAIADKEQAEANAAQAIADNKQALANEAQITVESLMQEVSKLESIINERTATYEELAQMRNELNMGWGEIAKSLGLHPSVLGLKRGLTNKNTNTERVRDTKSFKTISNTSNKEHGKSLALGLQGKAHKDNHGNSGSNGKGNSGGHNSNGKGNSGGNGNGGGKK